MRTRISFAKQFLVAANPFFFMKIKQADVVLLPYPLGYKMSETVQLSDLKYYSERTDAHGPAMTYSMHAIGWLDLGTLHCFLKSFLVPSLLSHLLLANLTAMQVFPSQRLRFSIELTRMHKSHLMFGLKPQLAEPQTSSLVTFLFNFSSFCDFSCGYVYLGH